MSRTRTALGLGLAAGLALTTALAGQAGAAPSKGVLGVNDCYDITGGSAGYTASTGVVLLNADFAAPSCRKGSYKLRVYDASGTLGSTTITGDGKSSNLSFSVTIPAAPAGSTVAIELTTFQTSNPGVVLDVAPDPLPINATTDQNQNGIQDDAEVLDGSSPVFQNFK